VKKEGGKPPPGGFLLYAAASLIAQSWKGSGLFYWRCRHQAGFIKQGKEVKE